MRVAPDDAAFVIVTEHPTSAFAEVPSTVWAWGTAAGIALGAGYALSPVSVWFAVAILALFAWAGYDLSERERRWVLGILTVAVVLRVLVIVVLFLATDHDHFVSFFWDGDGLALKRRSVSIRNVWLGIPIDPFLFSVAFDRLYGWTTYVYFLAYIQYWVGPAPYAIHLVSVTAFVASAVVMYRLVRSAYGRVPALAGLALMLFLPTPFAWSVSALKEAVYVLLCASSVAAIVGVARAGGVFKRLVALLLLVGSVATAGTVRVAGSLILMAGLVAGVAGGTIARRASLMLLALVIVPYGGYRILGNTDVQARVMSQLRSSAVTHLGNVRTEGHHYKLLDQRFYSDPAAMPDDGMTPMEWLRFTVRALVSFVVVPLPWQVESATEMVFLAQQVVWYLLVVFAAVGLVAGLRRDPLVTCVLGGVALAGAAAIALNSGNIGTMVRHRDTVVPFVVWLSALGAVTTVSVWMSRAGSGNSASHGGSRAGD